jgi:TPR repeat protein
MNADFNPRGGLTVDRDSLHASPGYARQVEAAKQLQERSVNADVEKAVKSWEKKCEAIRKNRDFWFRVAEEHRLARLYTEQALRDRDAEIARLNAECQQHLTRALENGQAAMQSEALLRDVSRYLDPRHFSEVIARINAHVGGEPEAVATLIGIDEGSPDGDCTVRGRVGPDGVVVITDVAYTNPKDY